MIKKLFALLFSCLAIDCIIPPERAECGGSFRYNPDTFSEYTADIESAETRFNAFVGKQVLSVKDNDGFCPIFSTNFPEQNRYGMYYPKTGVIYIDIEKMNNIKKEGKHLLFPAVLMHEVGHSFHMNHIGHTGNLMSEIVSYDFTEADKEECERVGLCE